jgi:hypothetical protein
MIACDPRYMPADRCINVIGCWCRLLSSYSAIEIWFHAFGNQHLPAGGTRRFWLVKWRQLRYSCWVEAALRACTGVVVLSAVTSRRVFLWNGALGSEGSAAFIFRIEQFGSRAGWGRPVDMSVPISQAGWHQIAREPTCCYRHDCLQYCVQCVWYWRVILQWNCRVRAYLVGWLVSWLLHRERKWPYSAPSDRIQSLVAVFRA